MTIITDEIALPSVERGRVVVPAPGDGPGNWSGAPSAVLVDGVFWLTYRIRRPLDAGRGVTTVVARSADGEHFDTVCELHRDGFGAASFERPVLLPTDDGGWRLYLSCATPDSKHWWIEAIDAATPKGLPDGRRQVVLPGSASVGVKDPVIIAPTVGVGPTSSAGQWRMFLCCHPLQPLGAEDRMTTRYLTSEDGLSWVDRGEVLSGSDERWDARGARVTTVLPHPELPGAAGTASTTSGARDGAREATEEALTVLYDGRRDAASNWYETTGVARWDGERLRPVADHDLARSPYSDGALRYASAVALPDGRIRFYFEAARPDGAHDLMTSIS